MSDPTPFPPTTVIAVSTQLVFEQILGDPFCASLTIPKIIRFIS